VPETFRNAAERQWRETARQHGHAAAARELLGTLWEFLRDSTPERRRQRYGDAGYDWDHRVNTTSAAVAWRDRLLGLFHSPYQPTEPDLFREMLDALERGAGIDFRDYTFIDLGSGKGRTLLMASDYPFRRIIGVELLPALHHIAQENLSHYYSEAQQCFSIESICGDARQFHWPGEPMVLYLFHPLPETGLKVVVANLETSFQHDPHPLYVLYHNPILERVLSESALIRKIFGTHQYSVFSFGQVEAHDSNARNGERHS
jgi:hypothetical protein